MRKRSNHEPASEEPPEKKALTLSPSTVDIKSGTILTDILGKKWRLGKTIGTGGFGLIYLASDNINHDVKTDAQYVAKVETYMSGPLFVERNCYLLIAKPDMINEWKEANNIQHLGMPHYVASGSHTTPGTRYRFLILPRFKNDLDKIFEAKKRKFNLKTVLTIALQTIDVLQYIHSKGYVHSDIKASNILLATVKTKSRSPVTSPIPKTKAIRYHGCTPLRTCKVRRLNLARSLRPNMNLRYLNDNEDVTEEVTCPSASPIISRNYRNNIDKLYLLDYGLATKYLSTQGEHKEFCSDMRKAHAGTILFCSRDAHEGAQSRRSDIECLGYNLVYWLTSNLPWSKDLENPAIVHQKKVKCIDNLKVFLDYSFNSQCPRFLFSYFNYIQQLKFEAQPDYNYFKTLFNNALREYGYKDNLLLDFNNLEGWGRKQKKVKCNSENFKVQRAVLKFKRSPLKSNLPIKLSPSAKPTLRKKTNKKIKRKMKWSKILDPEIIMKNAKSRERKLTESSDHLNHLAPSAMRISDLNQLNPTMAMREVFSKYREKHNNSNGTSPKHRGDTPLGNLEGYTPAMMEVYNRKKEREEMELEQLIVNSKSRSRSNSRSQSKRKKKKATPKNRARKRPSSSSPACSRPKKPLLDASTAINKKEAPRQTRTLQLRKTYSLRG